MRIIFTLSLVLSITQAIAQHFTVGGKDDQIKNLPSGKVYAVLTGNKSVDDELQDAVNKYWLVTHANFTDETKLAELQPVESNYFLILKLIMNDGKREPIPVSGIIKEGVFTIQIKSGGKEKNSVFGFVDADNTLTNSDCYQCQIPFIISELNQYLDLIIKNNIGYKVLDYSLPRLIDENSTILKSKTLLINKDYFNGKLQINHANIADEKDLKEYPYQIKFTTADDIAEKIKSDSAGYCYLSMKFVKLGETAVGGSRVSIYDLSTKQQIFYDTNDSRQIDKNVIKRIVQATEGKLPKAQF